MSFVWLLVALLGAATILIILRDAFWTVVLPERPARSWIALSSWFYRVSWTAWRAVATRLPPGPHRDQVLTIYGPLSILVLLGCWATGLIVGFGILYWGLGLDMQDEWTGRGTLGEYLYMSGTTFFTLGFGDFVPLTPLGRTLVVAEAGTGFAFLALVIGYLPVMYGSFSRREVNVLVVYGRASDPPSGGGLLQRYAAAERHDVLIELMVGWERWSAELLESHLSYPLLAYFRSQHPRQSWVGALTIALDCSALLTTHADGKLSTIGGETFSMARHVAVDLLRQLHSAPCATAERLDDATLGALVSDLRQAGLPLVDRPDARHRLAALRSLYEPYLESIANHLLTPLPPFWAPPTPDPESPAAGPETGFIAPERVLRFGLGSDDR